MTNHSQTTTSGASSKVDKRIERFGKTYLGAPRTASQYKRQVTEFAAFVDKPLELVTRIDVVDFIDHLRSGERICAKSGFTQLQELSPSTLKNYRSGLRAFYDWMVEREQVKHNPVTKIKLPKIRHTPGLTLTTDEISRVLTIDTGSARCSIQAHLLFKTALRVSELVSLRWSEVNFAQGTITKKGKGGKTRTIHLSRAIFQQLDAYQACQRTWAATRPKVKAALSHPDTAFVLLSYRGQPITPSTVNKQLKRRATKAGVLLHDSHESRTNDCASKISAHAMRRSSATQMRRQKVDIADIATFLGHESIETTLRHYAFPDEDVQQHAVNTLDEIA